MEERPQQVGAGGTQSESASDRTAGGVLPEEACFPLPLQHTPMPGPRQSLRLSFLWTAHSPPPASRSTNNPARLNFTTSNSASQTATTANKTGRVLDVGGGAPCLAHVLTVSPKRQKRGMRVPTTPLTTGPLLMPMRICTGSPVDGIRTSRAAASMACTGRQAVTTSLTGTASLARTLSSQSVTMSRTAAWVRQNGRGDMGVRRAVPYLCEHEDLLSMQRVPPGASVAHRGHAVLVLLHQPARHEVTVADGLHLPGSDPGDGGVVRVARGGMGREGRGAGAT
jgi:hypothetical protein